MTNPIDLSFSLDQLLPLIPFFIIFYMIGYFFPVMYTLFEVSRDQFKWSFIHYVGILTTSFLIFKLIPVEMTKELATGQDLFSRLTYAQQTLDTSLNNFPSLHVSLNSFTCLLLIKNMKSYLRYIFMILTFLIVVSTVLVKQHLCVDVIGGLFITYIAYQSFSRLKPNNHHHLKTLWRISVLGVILFMISQYSNVLWVLKSLDSYLNIL